MDFDNGGLSPSERQRQTAAEIARKKVLAAYSSTVENLKNLPPSSRDILLKNRQSQNNPYQSNTTYNTTSYKAPAYQPTQDWNNQNTYQTAEYQRTPLYSQPVANTTSPAPARPDYSTTQKRKKLQDLFKRRRQTKEAQAEDQNPSYSNYNSPESYTQPIETSAQTAQPTSTTSTENVGMLKDTAIDQEAINAEWQKYHSAWQDYYKKYYSEYYAKAAQSYLATEKMKNERVASGEVTRKHDFRRLVPIGLIILIILTGLFLQYNRLIFAPIMAYVSPDTGSVATSIEAVDPTLTQTVSPEPRLIIPKLNVDVPVEFNIPTSEVDAAMNRGVAQFSIPGANAMPGQIGNLVITGHSAGDIYSSNPYKFIFSGLERLEVGDLIYVNYESTRYTYQMTGRETVEPTNVAALIYETDRPMLTLITCTPLGTSRYRLLISAEQISPSYNSDNIANPTTPDPGATVENDPSMPANEPSFFEGLWNGLFGN